MNLEEEAELITQYHAGDEMALSKLVEENIALVKFIAGRHYKVNASLEEDLHQEGVIGLIEAFKRFNPKFSKQFAYYKSIWIRKKMSDFVKKNSRFGNDDEVSNSHLSVGDSTESRAFIEEVTKMVSSSGEFTKKEKDSFLESVKNGRAPRKKIREKLQSIYEKDYNRTFRK